MLFEPIFCCLGCLCLRRRRAGSTVSNRLIEEQPINEDLEGGEPPRVIELPDDDAVESDVRQDSPQQDGGMSSFPPLEEGSDDTPQQNNPEQGIEPGSHSTATIEFPPYNDPMEENEDVSTHTPSDGTSQQDSETGSHSTARTESSTHSDPTEENQKVGDSSDGVPQINDTETVGDQNSTDSQCHHESRPLFSPEAIAVLEAAGEMLVRKELLPKYLDDQSKDNNANAVP
ncbi:uncharacterized protein FSUBG_5957 [Fusarium subglutinans]|uniref:Uncharacterized protein n=1 Tax=Gibberella subglutinans TaxID=42677 RepID=A0A8H5V352_GIBSU|nr:uncharacterized protein FSUBG_5957 [Fusarium subglutinans]KAF5606559.1 hypothetical protein FSUBG_5957 [Fusarium subglutinans]